MSSVCSPLQLLNAIQLFGANLDDYLHLLLPPIVKLFDAPDVPLQARKSVPHIAVSCSHSLGSGENLESTLTGFRPMLLSLKSEFNCWFPCTTEMKLYEKKKSRVKLNSLQHNIFMCTLFDIEESTCPFHM